MKKTVAAFALAVFALLALLGAGIFVGQKLKGWAAAQSQDFQPSGTLGQTHTVTAGEDIYAVAIRWGVCPTELKVLNNLSSAELQEGMVLKIPGDGLAHVPAEEQQHVRVSASGTTYIVKAGEDIYSVAIRCGVSPSEIKEQNNLSTEKLQEGMVLKIPGVARQVEQE